MRENPLPDTLTIQVDGQARELFMSFGLLHELLRAVGDVSGASVIAIDADMREKVVVLVLSERDEKGRIVKEFPFYTSRVSTADMHEIFKWVGSHVLDFFLTAMETAVETHQPEQARLHRGET